MNERDPAFDEGARILDAFDFAGELAAHDARHRDELRSLLLAVLDVVDSFDRLLGDGVDPAGPVPASTCRLIARQLERALEGTGVSEVAALGQEVDLQRHHVVDLTSRPSSGREVVVEVVQRGFEWNGTLLRPAQVVAGPEEEEP